MTVIDDLADGALGEDSPQPPADHGGGSLHRLFVPVDTAGRGAGALALAARLASALEGSLRVVHVRVYDPPVRGSGRFFPETSDAAAAVVEGALLDAWSCGSRASGDVIVAERSRLAAAIAASAAEWGAGIIVLARRPRRALSRLFAPSLADQIMRQTSCPVLGVRAGQR
jgi:nucleotide-binding universal stress UspA family protein